MKRRKIIVRRSRPRSADGLYVAVVDAINHHGVPAETVTRAEELLEGATRLARGGMHRAARSWCQRALILAVANNEEDA